MPNKRILYVTTEMFPYHEDTTMSMAVNKMALTMYNEGNDVRVFMPRFGYISERKFQLHEVIRLSGMNIIINDLDQPLIIKVASLPGERLQVYFIDNEDYFKRKFDYQDEDGQPYEDNDERAMFFARGVIETIKKLNWVPDVVHLNGWMSAFVPIYLKHYYKNDSYFDDTQFVLSVYNEDDLQLATSILEKFKFDNMSKVKALKSPSTHSFIEEGMNLVDIIVKGDEFLVDELYSRFEKAKATQKEYINPEEMGTIY
ncbi:glycogen/starch synthase [Riemerella columbina]|uniref:glycogen/starch synthase n=1 Tax=Riemerella columbina TaxID=103810 RepID=UPI00266F5A83|nr:glycogen/starch synthase [Riemerella columbina]WKS95838.1 glycogen/starch synthase [Riemerella columbina]